MALLIPPRLVQQTDPLSADLTKLTFTPMTPEKIEAMGNDEIRSQFLAQLLEARTVGVTPNTLAELLMSRVGPMNKGEKLQEYQTSGTTFISAPFKYRQRERNMKVGTFWCAAGSAHPTAGVGGVPASAWRLTINVGPSPYATGFKNIARFFIPGHFLYIEHTNLVTNVAYTSAHKIYAATDADADNATVTVSAVGYTDAQWNALGANAKRPYQPTYGIVNLGANNVSDYESFGVNPPTDLTKELLIDWFQNIRTFRGETKEYMDSLKYIMDGKVNEYLADFQTLEMTKRNKQMMTFDEMQFLNTIWFGARAANQVANPQLADIQALEVAVDPEDGTPYERKANLLGIHTQLVENGRRIDLQGAPFDLDLLLEESHNLRRTRKLDGTSWERITWMTDRWTKDNWDQALTRYLQDLYGYSVTRYITPEKMIVEGTNIIAFEYTVYSIPREHLEIAIMSHDFFEDKILSVTDGTNGSINARPRARMAVSMDFMDIKIAVAAMNSAQREYKGQTTANANSMWSKVIKLNTKKYELRSKFCALEFGDFGRHSIFENFSDACPILTARACAPRS